jgi:hypothetical protein
MGECLLVEAFQVIVQSLESRTLDASCSTSETTVDNFVGEADSFKDL